MNLVYLFLRLYPFFGLSLFVVFLDLARIMRRRGQKIWMGLVLVSGFWLVSTVVWLILRGDKNTDTWFLAMMKWFSNK